MLQGTNYLFFKCSCTSNPCRNLSAYYNGQMVKNSTTMTELIYESIKLANEY